MQQTADLDLTTNNSRATTSYRLHLTATSGPFQYSDPYIDVIWTPLLGPCATALLRCLAHTARANPEHPAISTETLAALIGVSPNRMTKALTRLAKDQLITINGQTITLPNGAPKAPAHRIAALPDTAISYATNRHQATTR